MTNESQRYNCFTRNGGNATPKHASPEAKGSNPTTKLTLLWARNPVRRNFNHWKVSRKPRNRLPRVMKHYSPTDRRNHGRPLKRLLDTWDRNGSTSGPTPWHIWWGWWFNKAYHIQQRAQLGKRKKYPPPHWAAESGEGGNKIGDKINILNWPSIPCAQQILSYWDK